MKSSGRRRLEPPEHLPLRDDHARAQPSDVVGVRARRQHDTIGLDLAAVGPHADTVLAGRPLQHPLSGSQLGAVGTRRRDVSHDAPFGEDEAAVALVDHLQVLR